MNLSTLGLAANFSRTGNTATSGSIGCVTGWMNHIEQYSLIDLPPTGVHTSILQKHLGTFAIDHLIKHSTSSLQY